ncbi:hypothetical protein PC116_g16573 [Phytophthora cactorum]|uniref:Uncharacterized protein n=1 Tax=Phytophthora cactorum TaxID=29920 RepID=A0A8T1D7B1_9STRA|nr:hypothetical protein PC117_g12096 [Phytophthora cactorum]KAG3025134.1 hypothetical protein PC120_g6664 [Phytophthora cactorum]KAG3163155.1 hypothetical protein C6341_g13045 [Phytophthora cactorum]KAG3200097.1 hypothetical protein PC128_g4845 [Phytophthora cactorum]KAG4235292.1 hypothetical protein PC116_g16573 [Phytophthora cactorum]
MKTYRFGEHRNGVEDGGEWEVRVSRKKKRDG